MGWDGQGRIKKRNFVGGPGTFGDRGAYLYVEKTKKIAGGPLQQAEGPGGLALKCQKYLG